MEGAIAQKPQQWLYTCDPTGIHNPVCPWLIRQSSDKRDTRTETKSFTVALCCPPHLPAGNVNACWSWVTFLCDEEGIDVEQRTSFSPPPFPTPTRTHPHSNATTVRKGLTHFRVAPRLLLGSHDFSQSPVPSLTSYPQAFLDSMFQKSVVSTLLQLNHPRPIYTFMQPFSFPPALRIGGCIRASPICHRANVPVHRRVT